MEFDFEFHDVAPIFQRGLSVADVATSGAGHLVAV
jgi:hypothetical protein